MPRSLRSAAAPRPARRFRLRPVARGLARWAALSCALLCTTFAGSAAAQCAEPAFTQAPGYAAGRGANSVAAADFDGDGVADLAVANLRSNNVSILLGDGVGGFGPPTNFAVSQEPSSIAVGDFNKDGKADLAVGHFFGGGPVSALFGDGAGRFSAAVVVANINGPTRVAVADFNGDTNPDIAVGAFLGSARILLGDGAGGFSVRTLPVTGDSRLVTTGEFNGDGIADAAFALAASFPGEVVIVLGNSGGTFAAGTRVPLNQTPKALAARDLNGDGRDDLVVTVQHFEPQLSVVLNDGAGGFGAPTNHITNGDPNAVAVADFDGDAKQDVAVASTAGNSVRIYAGDGAGGLVARPTQYVTGKQPVALAVGDFNADGKTDLVSANAVNTSFLLPPPEGVSVLLGDGAGAFAAARSYRLMSTPSALVTGDFDNNGRSDLATSFAFSPLIMISLDDGAGGIAARALLGTVQHIPTSLAAGDFNGDGRLDLAAANENGTVSVFFGLGTGLFADPPLHVTVGSGPNFVAAGNFNGDARTDLVVGLGSPFGSGSAVVLLANGGGGFNPAPGSPFAAAPNLAVGDFNGDGRDDLADAASPANTVSLLLNDGAGRMTLASTTPIPVTNFTGLRVVVADLNRDGLADVVTANARARSVTVFLGNGAGGLGAGTSFASGDSTSSPAGPFDLKAADFNGDGNPDLAVSNNDSISQGDISILSGDGTGALAPAVAFNSGGNPGYLAVGDFNADARPDLAVTGPAASVTLLTNTSAAALPCLSVSDATVTEGDAGTLAAEFTVSLSAPSTGIVRVNYSLADTTAAAGADYTPVSGRLVFAPGETTKTIPVSVRGDVLNESDETFRLVLASPSGATLADREGLGTILNNDPLPSLSVNDITVSESGFLTHNFTVTLSAPSGLPVTVQFATADGTAIASTPTALNDYLSASATLTIPAGQTTGTVGVVVADDAMFEPDEHFFLNLSNPTNATIADAQGVAVIQNNDPMPELIFTSSPFLTEGNAGTQNALVTVSLSNTTTQTVTFNYATADGTATAGSDYVAAAGTATINPGESSVTIPVAVNGDTADEIHEGFFFDISGAQNATVENGRAVVTIVDDDGPTISVGDITVEEGDGGTTDAFFTVTLSAASPQSVSVRLTPTPGTATAFADFTPRVGTLTLPPGLLSARVPIPVVGDTIVEADETFFVNLSNPVNGSIADAQGTCVIKDDDGAAASMQFAAAAFNAAEGAHFVTVTVSRTGDTAAESFVSYATADGTATERKDYVGAVGRLRFAPGETSRSFDILVTDDRFDDDGESFRLTLSNPVGGALGPQTDASVSIADNDAANGPSPVKDASLDHEFFVRTHYADFLGRVPDQAGLDFWVGQMTGCGASDPLVCRINVSAAFFLSIENQETGYLTYRAHKAAYGNLAGKPVPLTLREHLAGSRRIGEGVEVGIGDWQQRLEANKAAFFDELTMTSRFASLYGGLNDPQYVEALNQNAGLVLSLFERNVLVGDLVSGRRTRAQVLRAVAEDADFAAAERNRAFVLAQYFGYLRRDPDAADFRGIPDPNFDGYNFWLQKLNQFNGNFVDAEMVRAFIQSIEYGERFGQ